MINITEQMNKMMESLNSKGFGNCDFRIRKECVDVWSKDYAIVQDFYYDNFNTNEEYFDHDRYRLDLMGHIEEFFKSEGETLIRITHDRNKYKKHKNDKNTIIIWFYWESQEIEVHRMGTDVN